MQTFTREDLVGSVCQEWIGDPASAAKLDALFAGGPVSVLQVLDSDALSDRDKLEACSANDCVLSFEDRCEVMRLMNPQLAEASVMQPGDVGLLVWFVVQTARELRRPAVELLREAVANLPA